MQMQNLNVIYQWSQRDSEKLRWYW